LPVVTGAVIVRMESSEEVDRRNPADDEVVVVAAPGAGTLSFDLERSATGLTAVAKSASIDGATSRPLTSTAPFARPTMSRFNIAMVPSFGMRG